MRSRCHSPLPGGKCAGQAYAAVGRQRIHKREGRRVQAVGYRDQEARGRGQGGGAKKKAACKRATDKTMLAQQNRRIAPSTRCQRTGGNAICTWWSLAEGHGGENFDSTKPSPALLCMVDHTRIWTTCRQTDLHSYSRYHYAHAAVPQLAGPLPLPRPPLAALRPSTLTLNRPNRDGLVGKRAAGWRGMCASPSFAYHDPRDGMTRAEHSRARLAWRWACHS